MDADSALIGVQTLHSRRDFSGDGYGWAVCAECRQTWPCETIKMIEAHMGAEVPF